jgi:hypothetical protein
MNFCHGIWAVALLLSTGLATVLIAIGASVFTHFLGVAIATGLCLVLIQAKLYAAPPIRLALPKSKLGQSRTNRRLSFLDI